MALTGVLLAFGYAPSTASAWESVRAIDQNPWGRLIRGLHHWAASGVIVLAGLHLARVFLYAAYRPPRQWTWVAGVGLLLVLLGFGLTGYLLPWDLKAYFGTQVATAIPASLPIIGPFLGRLIRGASDVGDFTLTRFYAVHVILLPAALTALVLVHLRLVRNHGITPPFVDEGEGVDPERTFFPYHAWKDSLAVLIIMAAVFYLALKYGAPLGDKADPTNSTYVPRPSPAFWTPANDNYPLRQRRDRGKLPRPDELATRA
jgi:ubiquinol-cytochrome c reductase cytochrome b subunit